MYHQYYVKVHKYRHRACFEATPVGSATPYCSNLFTASALFPRCFSLSTDTDVGGSKQYHVLVSAKRTIKPVQGCTDLIAAPQNRTILQSSTDGRGSMQ